MASNNHLKVGSNEMELVDFRIFKQVGDKTYEGIYGVNVAKVKEIIKMPKLTELPGVPEYIEGIFDLRGVVIPVIDLAKWMGVKVPQDKEKNKRVIIAEFNNIYVSFVVHEAKRIRRINWSDIEPASFSGGGDGVFDKSKITGVTKIENDDVLLILDLESVVAELGLYHQDVEDNVEVEKFNGIALALDDSPVARKYLKNALEKMGFKVIEANDGVEGLSKLDELYNTYQDAISKNVKIIVSDVEMPQMDGFHFAANVKDDPRFSKIPVVFNSSISDHFSEDRGQQAGGEAYLVKFDAGKFYKEISRIVKAHVND
jgi:two-component system chemotaxis response regulator CheV